MAKNKKVITVLSTAAITGLITTALGSTAFAKTADILVNNGNTNYKYDLTALNGSYADYVNDSKQGALYQDYASKIASGKIAAVYDDAQKAYIDFAKLSSDFSDAIANGKTFDLNAYTEASKNTVAEDPSTISDATVGTDGKIVYTPEQAPVTNLAVSSVSAINAKQVKVVFNKAIDATKLNASNFVVTQTGDIAGTDRLTDSITATNFVGAGQNASGFAGQPGTGRVDVQSDNMTVILTLDNSSYLTNSTTVSVATSGVVAADGTTLAATVTNTDKLADLTAPTVVKAETAGSNVVRVYFSEPIVDTAARAADSSVDATALNNGAAFTINDGAVAVDGANITRDPNNANAVLLKTASPLVSGTVYTIKVANTLVDYAGYSVLANSSVSFTQTADTNVPTVTAESKAENRVRLSFNKTVNIPTDANIVFRYAYNSDAANVIRTAANDAVNVAAVNVAGRTDSAFDVTLPEAMNPGTGVMYIHYVAPANAAKTNVITDQYGNVLPDGTAVNFTVTADTTAPTATAVYYDATHIDVTYSEAVNNAQTTTNYSLKSPAGADVAISSVAVQDPVKHIYRLTVGSMANGGNYALSINDKIVDTAVAQNKLVPYSTTLVVPDTYAPTLVPATAVSVSGADINHSDTLYVAYSEPMATTGAMSVLEPTNYRLTGVGISDPLPAGTTLTQNGSVVVIKLPAAPTKAYTGLTVGKVADVAGNPIVDNVNRTAVLSTVCTPFTVSAKIPAGFVSDLTTVKATDTKTIVFNVNRQLKSVDAAKIHTTGTPANGTSATFVNNADGTATVTVKLDAALPADLSGVAMTFDAGAITDISSLSSAVDAATVTGVNDYAAPTMGAVTTLDNSPAGAGNGKIDQITIAYNEPLYIPSVNDADYTVDGYEITGVSVVNGAHSSTVTLSVKEKATVDRDVTPKVTQVGEVEDNSAQRNKLGAQASVTATDGILSVAAAGSITYGTPVVGDTIVVDGVTFTAAADDTGNDFSTEASLTTKINALADVNATDAAGTITITAATPGVEGNTITLSKTGTGTEAVSGANLIGGTH